MPRRSANELTPPAELVARFRRDLEAILRSSSGGGAPGEDTRLAVAVSGGPDSLALLLLAHAAFPGAVCAATVDHGLRPEAADEAKFVADLCEALEVPHTILTGTVPTGNLQESARALRYALLAEWAEGRARWVATAHQQDDLAETFLMRARRGAGVGGLAAMRAVRPLMGDMLCASHPGEGRGPASGDNEAREGAIASALQLGPGLRRGGTLSTLLIRPLLSWSRGELNAIVAQAGIAAVHDPSNADPRFDRSRIRQLLAESLDLPADRLALAARNLRHAEDALAWAAAREWKARSRIEGDAVWLDAADLPYELLRRLVACSVDWVRAETEGLLESAPLRGESLDRLLATLQSGGTGTIAGVKASAKHALWRFSAAPARRSH